MEYTIRVKELLQEPSSLTESYEIWKKGTKSKLA
jgi:hypothetical protein